MSRELLLPELAESVVEGEIIKWLVAEGETVAEDQPVVEVMTDKVTVELPSPYSGQLQKHLAAEGDVVKVNQAIALFADESAAAASSTAPAPNTQAAEERSIVESGANEPEDDGDSLSLFKPGDKGEDGPVYQIKRPAGGAAGGAAATALAARDVATSVEPAGATPAPATALAPSARGPHGRVPAVPAARKLARELDVDLESVVGSGPNGRVRVDDVRSHAAGGSAPGGATAGLAARRGRTSYSSPAEREALEERRPVRGLRRVIANQMVASHLQTVRTLHVDEADVSGLVRLRDRLRPAAAKRGVKLSYMPFIMKAVATALAEYPMINASLDEEKNEIVVKHYVNLGLAVATDAGLVVPVIHDVPNRSVLELAAEVDRVATAAREGKLAADDVKGGTFSITNIGSLGGLFSFPIINVPEAAILGVHSIKKRPVVLADESIVARSMIYLSLSFDHRIIDGAEGAMFTGRVIELLETPEELFLDL